MQQMCAHARVVHKRHTCERNKRKIRPTMYDMTRRHFRDSFTVFRSTFFCQSCSLTEWDVKLLHLAGEVPSPSLSHTLTRRGLAGHAPGACGSLRKKQLQDGHDPLLHHLPLHPEAHQVGARSYFCVKPWVLHDRPAFQNEKPEHERAHSYWYLCATEHREQPHTPTTSTVT